MDYAQLLKDNGFCIVEVDASMPRSSQELSKYTIISMCLQGEAEYELNMEHLKVGAGMRLTFFHVAMLKVTSMTPDFKAIVLAMDDNFAIDPAIGIDPTVLQLLFGSPVGVINDPMEWKLLLNFMQGLQDYQQLPGRSHSIEICGALYRCILLLCSEVEARNAKVSPISGGQTVADLYFRRFIHLVTDKNNIKKEHEVMFYAKALCISPKHLSEICKQKSGYKAKEIISRVLISQLKRELIMSGNSVKMIAYEYGFADQSSLGKFFRKMTGISPLSYKSNISKSN